ncbi:MAG TPA: DUF5939 domain-containing protein, partial [Polyangia bacterium]|nr:DUF5939 domain-containing protein [Polyangia bacterium]
MSAVVVEHEVSCKSSVHDLWNVLTDTSYLNRLSGEAPRHITPIDGTNGARYRIRMKAGGFNVEWQEWPFEWVAEDHFRTLRLFDAGPVSSVDTLLTFSPDHDRGGARVVIRLELMPKLSWLRFIIRLGARKAADALAAAVRKIDAALVQRQPLPQPQKAPIAPAPAPSPADSAHGRATERLRTEAPPALADRLSRFVAEARDEELGRIRPFALAAEWGVDRRELLATCLQAVRVGLLELRWEVICPSCRVGAEVVSTLSAVKAHATCHLCEIAFGLELDEALEATFTPTPAVRRIDVAQYCVGGPARTPHVLAQAALPARGRVKLPVPATVGRYRLFARGGAMRALELTADAPADVEVTLGDATPARVQPGGSVTIVSNFADERHVKLERVVTETLAASAREVTAMPGFRRDFAAEVLRPDLALKVSTVTLFFSDLTASTQLYADVGDAPALKLVHDHFDLVLAILSRHGGTLVKTIGDAVMAAFNDDLDAVAASLEALTAFEKFRREAPNGERTHLKLGVYRGPSYLVTANGVL